MRCPPGWMYRPLGNQRPILCSIHHDHGVDILHSDHKTYCPWLIEYDCLAVTKRVFSEYFVPQLCLCIANEIHIVGRQLWSLFASVEYYWASPKSHRSQLRVLAQRVSLQWYVYRLPGLCKQNVGVKLELPEKPE